VSALDRSVLPPNARMQAVRFNDASKMLCVQLRGAESEREVSADSIAALFGARIRHEKTQLERSAGINFGKAALSIATAIPMPIKDAPVKKAAAGEELDYALALRSDDVSELWYLIGTSFNFRKALGPEATYSGEMNLRLFVKRLVRFAPHAVQDGFITAIDLGSALPPPVETLHDFFRYASAKQSDPPAT
jgi:hypothetical protein